MLTQLKKLSRSAFESLRRKVAKTGKDETGVLECQFVQNGIKRFSERDPTALDRKNVGAGGHSNITGGT